MYWFVIDANGKPVFGVAAPPGSVQGSREVWENQDRAFYDAATGTWTIYDPIAVTASPNQAAVNDVVEVTATLPTDTPDAEVTFAVEGGAPVTEPVVQGQATHAYAFSLPGTYSVTVSSAHHGSQTIEVTTT